MTTRGVCRACRRRKQLHRHKLCGSCKKHYGAGDLVEYDGKWIWQIKNIPSYWRDQ